MLTNKLNFALFEKPRNKHGMARYWVNWINDEWYRFALPGWIPPLLALLLIPFVLQFLIVRRRWRNLLKHYAFVANPLLGLFGIYRILELSQHTLVLRLA